MNIDAVSAWHRTVVHDYTLRDSALYALAIGGVSDSLDQRQIRLVDEECQIAVPSMAGVIASPGFWARDDKSMEIDFTRLVHAEQRIELDRPLPAEGRVIGTSRVTRIVDKGAGKGALITVCKTLESDCGERFGRAWQVFFCRGDGGFSESGSADLTLVNDTLPVLEATPTREPDHHQRSSVRNDAALLYRLCGDRNRLHIDALIAQRAGFSRPILHGLATYGFAAIAAIRTFADGDAKRLIGLDARFSAPLYPGEELEFRMWDEGTHVAIEGHVVARNAVVISHGRARFQ